jgi:RNA polymerase sigma factor (TIGR02999 family)
MDGRTLSEISRIIAAAPDTPLLTAEILPIVYDELRAMARRKMAGMPQGMTLQPTALVHEVWLSLNSGPGWQGKRHFLAAASEAMRRILVDSIRSRSRQKRGGGRRREDIDDVEPEFDVAPDEIAAVDEVLTELETAVPRAGEIMKLRYFGGLTIEESAEALGVSLTTAKRDWRVARALVWSRLNPGEPSGDDEDAS